MRGYYRPQRHIKIIRTYTCGTSTGVVYEVDGKRAASLVCAWTARHIERFGTLPQEFVGTLGEPEMVTVVAKPVSGRHWNKGVRELKKWGAKFEPHTKQWVARIASQDTQHIRAESTIEVLRVA